MNNSDFNQTQNAYRSLIYSFSPLHCRADFPEIPGDDAWIQQA